jgi:Flp pilus assembly protein TadB
MGAKKKGGGGRQPTRPIKGFRPGREPAHLRKRQAKAQLGDDASWAEKQAVELVADRSPGEVRSVMKRWIWGLLAATVVLAVAGTLLYAWALWAGIVVHLLAAAAGFLWYRMRRQRDRLVQMAEAFGKPSGGGSPRKRKKR